jgi:rSAM/selenodomain-associated transferase 2
MKLSVIIPALNAIHLLPAAVARLKAEGVDEIIIADGGSTPPPSGLGESVQVISAASGRGQQLQAGAAAATGDWLLFLHADTRLGDGWREAVRDHVRDHPGYAAFFRFALDDASPAARRLERVVALRCRLLALPYGDQGLLISRRLYGAVGGFRPIPLMEDVDIVRRIGRARLVTLDVPAVTSAARYRREGYLRRMGRNLLCLSLFFAGVDPARIRKIYA